MLRYPPTNKRWHCSTYSTMSLLRSTSSTRYQPQAAIFGGKGGVSVLVPLAGLSASLCGVEARRIALASVWRVWTVGKARCVRGGVQRGVACQCFVRMQLQRSLDLLRPSRPSRAIRALTHSRNSWRSDCISCLATGMCPTPRLSGAPSRTRRQCTRCLRKRRCQWRLGRGS